MIKYKISQEMWDDIEHIVISNGYDRIHLNDNSYMKVMGEEEECNLELYEYKTGLYIKNDKMCFDIIWDNKKNKITQTIEELDKRFEVSVYA